MMPGELATLAGQAADQMAAHLRDSLLALEPADFQALTAFLALRAPSSRPLTRTCDRSELIAGLALVGLHHVLKGTAGEPP
jgi:hypothetical protein